MLVGLLLLAATARAELKLASVFGDNMVLQRDMPVPVWGSAESGDEITVTFAGQTKTTKADPNGSWKLSLDPLPASSTPRDLVAQSAIGNSQSAFTNLLVGEVWLCGGQSNMGLHLRDCFNAEQEIAAANCPQLRFLAVPAARKTVPVDRLAGGAWKICTPETAAGFAGVAYFFGRALHRELGVPIGLIEFDRGATGIEGWAPLVGFQRLDDPAAQAMYREAASWDPQSKIGKAAHREAFRQIKDWLPKAKAALAAGGPVSPEPLLPAPAVNVPGPAEIFNGAINPLVPFAIKGAVWYQGESNPGEGRSYELKMTAMVRGWRQVWGRGDFPVYWVQLANEGNPSRDPDKEPTFRYVPVREAQRRVLKEPNTGMVVAIDLGEDASGHPRNKKDVGERLALWALANDYGKQVPFSGPLYKSHKIKGDKAIVSFDQVGTGLMVADKDGLEPVREVKDAALGQFAIRGADGVWHWADAEIVGQTVVIRSDQVAAPKAVRYAYSMNPKGPKLYNREGLPASPFSTDAW